MGTDPAWRRDRLTAPNVMSALRFPLAAAFPFASDGGRIAVVAAAAASDWIDGRLARSTGRVTKLGELLDPVADKTFTAVALLTLVVEGSVPVWILPVLLLRDIGVAVGVLALALRRQRVRMRARRTGKLVTWLQFAAVAAMLLMPGSAVWIAPIVGAAGVIALWDYARSARRQLQD